MALTVNTNTASTAALYNLGRTSRSLSGSFERISSGLRISAAKDDAAGLGVAEALDASEKSARVAMRNTNDGMSLISVAEGGTSEVSNIVKRMRELAVQSASETLDDDERAYIQDEYVQLAGEIDRIASVTEFNGVALLEGTNTQIGVQVGISDSANDSINLTMGDLRATVIGVDTGSIDLSTASGATAALSTLDTALDTLSAYRSDYGAMANRLDSALSNLETFTENISSAQSQIRDADFAYETAEMSKLQVMQQAGLSILAQANGLNEGVLALL